MARMGMLQVIIRFPAFVVALTAGLALAGLVYQAVATVWDKVRYRPPGKIITVNGRRMHIRSIGAGRTTVVLETGLGGISSGWAWIQPEIAKFARVISYDRLGLGWSEPGKGAVTARRIAGQLHDLLRVAGEKGPYVLVGHSMGGLFIRKFAELYAGEVVGMVLVDACHPDQYVRSSAIRKHMQAGFTMLRKIQLPAMFGFIRLTNYLKSQADGLPPRARAEAEAFLSSFRHLRSAQAEASAWDTICDEVRDTKDLGDKPLAVLRADSSSLAGGQQLQEELTSLSSRGKLHLVEGSEHVTLVTHKEYAISVVEAIRDVVREAESSGCTPHAT